MEFCNGFYGNYKKYCDGFYCICIFFQQGNDTHTFLHIIDNIELKLDFANLKSQSHISVKIKTIAIRYFPQIAQL